jgi:hypothetical protein
MAITVKELARSRPGDDGSRDLIYWAHADAAEEDPAAIDAVVAASPSTYDGLPREGVSDIEPLESLKDWIITVRYGSLSLDLANGGATLLSFSTTGGSFHVTQSLATVASAGPTGMDIPVTNGAIGGGFGQEPSGVDVPGPAFNFAIRRKFPAEEVTAAYIADLVVLSGSANDATFSVTASGITLSFVKGELLFLGADSPEPEADGSGFYITFHFSASPHLDGGSGGDPRLTIEGLEPLDEKEGWHFLWVMYEQQQDTDAEVVIPRPRAAYVEQVVPYGDFDLLDLPP